LNQTTQFSLVVAAVVVTFCAVVLVRGPGGPPTTATADASSLDDDDRRSGDGGLGDGGVVDEELEVKSIMLVDGSETRRSIRVMHPSPVVTRRVLDWLEPLEAKALQANAHISCEADTATKRLVSIRCVTVAFYDPKNGGSPPNAEYTAKTIAISGRLNAPVIKELALSDVLKPDAGEAQVVEACKKMADPPLPCTWPPTAFTINRGETLFLCHGSNCVDLDPESGLLREGLVSGIRH